MLAKLLNFRYMEIGSCFEDRTGSQPGKQLVAEEPCQKSGSLHLDHVMDRPVCLATHPLYGFLPAWDALTLPPASPSAAHRDSRRFEVDDHRRERLFTAFTGKEMEAEADPVTEMFGPMDFRPVGCSSPAPSPPPPEQHYGPPCFHTVHEDVCSLGARPSVQPPLVSAGATPRYLVGFGQYRLLGPASGLPDQRPAAGRLTSGLVFPPSCSIACPALSKDRAIDTPSSAPCRDGHDWQNGVHSSPPPAIGIHRGGSWQPVVHLPDLSAERIWPRGSLRDHAQICLHCLLFFLFSRDLQFCVSILFGNFVSQTSI
jgi:hypothetical protein